MSIAAGAIGGAVAGAAAAIGESFAVFAKGAASGSFAISETGGKALLQAIRNMKDWVDENRGDVSQLSVQPKLGGSHGANVMAPFVAEVASDDQGFVPMLMKLRESLEDAERGITDAMKNYQAMDQRSASRQSSG
jgi:hypothetical protein